MKVCDVEKRTNQQKQPLLHSLLFQACRPYQERPCRLCPLHQHQNHNHSQNCQQHLCQRPFQQPYQRLRYLEHLNLPHPWHNNQMTIPMNTEICGQNALRNHCLRFMEQSTDLVLEKPDHYWIDIPIVLGILSIVTSSFCERKNVKKPSMKHETLQWLNFSMKKSLIG